MYVYKPRIYHPRLSVYTYIQIWIYIHKHMSVHMYTYIYAYTHVNVCTLIHANVNIFTCIHIWVYTHTYIQTHMYTSQEFTSERVTSWGFWSIYTYIQICIPAVDSCSYISIHAYTYASRGFWSTRTYTYTQEKFAHYKKRYSPSTNHQVLRCGSGSECRREVRIHICENTCINTHSEKTYVSNVNMYQLFCMYLHLTPPENHQDPLPAMWRRIETQARRLSVYMYAHS